MRNSATRRGIGAVDKESPLEKRRRASRFGQSVWLDFIRRSLITGGELRRLIDEDGLRGVTSNPSIFEKAIIGSTDYRAVLSRRRTARSTQRRL